MEYTVIDDFLPQETFNEIRDIMMVGGHLEWYYNSYVGYEDDNNEHFQFTHKIYLDHEPRSNFFFALKPVVDLINPKSLIRIKANLAPRSTEIKEQAWHTDVDYSCRTAILYMNDNNGYTIFEDGTKIESKANRFVEFDSQLKHTGTTHTDAKVRVVINFNYFK